MPDPSAQLRTSTSPDLDGAHAAGRVLAIPVGSTEQHGPHLPLTTDTDIASALVSGLADRHPEVVVGSPLAYGASGEHQAFPGTISIGHDALEKLLVELGRSATLTFRRLLYVNAHGGNTVAIRRAVTRLRREGRDVRAWAPTWPGDAHAGQTETSLMLHLDASRVHHQLARAGRTDPIHELMGQLRRDGVQAVTPNGVLGDPAGASARIGLALLDRALTELHEFVTEWAEPLQRPAPSSSPEVGSIMPTEVRSTSTVTTIRMWGKT